MVESSPKVTLPTRGYQERRKGPGAESERASLIDRVSSEVSSPRVDVSVSSPMRYSGLVTEKSISRGSPLILTPIWCMVGLLQWKRCSASIESGILRIYDEGADPEADPAPLIQVVLTPQNGTRAANIETLPGSGLPGVHHRGFRLRAQLITQGFCPIDRGGYVVLAGANANETEGWANEIVHHGATDQRVSAVISAADGVMGSPTPMDDSVNSVFGQQRARAASEMRKTRAVKMLQLMVRKVLRCALYDPNRSPHRSVPAPASGAAGSQCHGATLRAQQAHRAVRPHHIPHGATGLWPRSDCRLGHDDVWWQVRGRSAPFHPPRGQPYAASHDVAIHGAK